MLHEYRNPVSSGSREVAADNVTVNGAGPASCEAVMTGTGGRFSYIAMNSVGVAPTVKALSRFVDPSFHLEKLRD